MAGPASEHGLRTGPKGAVHVTVINLHIAVTIRRHTFGIDLRFVSTPGRRLRLAVAALIAAAALVSVAHALDPGPHAREVGVTAAPVTHAPAAPTPALNGAGVTAVVVCAAWFIRRVVAHERSGFRWTGRGNVTRRGPPVRAIP